MHRWGRRAGNGGLGIRVQPYFLELDMLNSNGDPVPRWFGILLPHELFADMMCTPGDRGYDHLLGKPGTLQEFWDLQRDQDWFQAHPLRDTLGGQHDIPIRLWGDDRPLGKKTRTPYFDMVLSSGSWLSMGDVISYILRGDKLSGFHYGAGSSAHRGLELGRLG